MSDYWLFSFAAKGLQSYIMRGGKLRDMVGATSLIDKLSSKDILGKEWLPKVFGVTKGFKVESAAGQARIYFNDEVEANAFAQRWSIWCHTWAPDLEMVEDLRKVTSGGLTRALRDSSAALERARSFAAARLPEAGPFVFRAPRSGEPGVEVEKWTDPVSKNKSTEIIDTASRRKRAERDAFKDKLPPIAEAFGFATADELPNDFEQVSGGERDYLAVVHADGNRLGQMFINVTQALLKVSLLDDDVVLALFRYLSESVVSEGAQAAAGQAMKTLRNRVEKQREIINAQLVNEGKPPMADQPLPFAPIVLAGDDLTVVTRADLGVAFAEEFLKAFEAQMGDRLRELTGQPFWAALPQSVKDAVPDKLSAGAGVVFCTAHYPFSLAYELCESVAKQAKDAAKKRVGKNETPPSALSFIRISGASAPTDFDGLTKTTLRASDDETLLSACPYYVDANTKHTPQLSSLWDVVDAARSRPDPEEPKKRLGMPSSALRELLTLFRQDKNQVPDAVARMIEVAGDRADPFLEGWKKLCPAKSGADWKDLRLFGVGTSPIADLLTLLAVKAERPS